jgi:hypothetical protein
MSRELGVALVAVVVLAAGAAGVMVVAGAGDAPTLQQGNETNETPNATAGNATDAGNATGNATADALPPGVSEAGVDNASALVAAHRDALEATGYTFEFRQNYSVDAPGNETVPMALADTNASQNGSVGEGLAPFRVHTESERAADNGTQLSVVDYWGNETVVAVRAEQGNQTQYRTFQRTANDTGTAQQLGQPSFDAVITKSRILAGVLRSGSFEVAGTEETEDGTLVTLRATEYNASLGVDPENVTAYNATVVVDERGMVHEFDFRLASTNREFPVELRYRFEVTDLGPRNVTEPAWIADAFEAAGAQVAVGTENQSYFTVTNTGDRPLRPGTTVVISQDGAKQTVEVERPVPPSRTVYIAPGDGNASVGYGSPPEGDFAALSGSYEVTVRSPSGGTAGQASFTFGNETAGNATADNATDDATAGNATDAGNATGNATAGSGP